MFQKCHPHQAVVTSCSPRYTETTKQGKTAVCLRFISNSLLARFLWKMAWAAYLSLGCPSSPQPQPMCKQELLGYSLARSQHFLGEAPALAPCQASGLQRDSALPPQGEVLGLSCCQRVEACSAFSPWKTPACGLALPPALDPFRIFSFLLGKSGLGWTFQLPYSRTV